MNDLDDDDVTLLRRYVRDQSQAAFTALVTRHVAVVYAAALRQVGGDRHLAHDVTQRVFLTLAMRAATLMNRPFLLSWLYTTTRNLASTARRTEYRRRKREATVTFDPALASFRDSPPHLLDDPRWSRVFDDALSSLRELDRSALLFRFFQDLSFEAVGRRLGCQEEAARKRVARALEHLRSALHQRGLTASPAAVWATLAQHTTAAASVVPAGLAESISAVTLTGVATSAKMGGGLGGFAFLMNVWTKTAIVGSVVVGAATYLFVGTPSFSDPSSAELPPADHLISADRSEKTDLLSNPEASAPVALDSGVVRPQSSAPEPSPKRRPIPYQPVSQLKDVGTKTPRETLQTFFAAKHNAQVESMSSLLLLEKSAKAIADDQWQRLPDETRQNFNSPAEMMATFYASATPVESLAVMHESIVEGKDARLHVAVRYPDGRERLQEWNLRATPDGWRVVMPGRLAVKFVSFLSHTPRTTTQQR